MVLNPATPIGALEEILDEVALILVMTVNPGFGGQTLIPSALEKVRRLRSLLDTMENPPRIEVDGGVNWDTLEEVLAAGADVLVMGSAIFDADEGPGEAVRAYRRAIDACMQHGD